MTVDTSRAMKKLSGVEKQVNFATARALTLTAKDAQKELTQDLPEIFEDPTPFTKRGLAIIPANKVNLQAFVFVKDIQAGYLARQQVGGQRRPRPGSPILLPVRLRTNRYGNIARGRIAREKAKPNVFFVSGRRKRTKHLPPGIYQRPKSSGRRRRRPAGLKLLVALEQRAQYRPRFQMHERVGRVVLKRFPDHFNDSLRSALASARK